MTQQLDKLLNVLNRDVPSPMTQQILSAVQEAKSRMAEFGVDLDDRDDILCKIPAIRRIITELNSAEFLLKERSREILQHQRENHA